MRWSNVRKNPRRISIYRALHPYGSKIAPEEGPLWIHEIEHDGYRLTSAKTTSPDFYGNAQ